VTLSHFVLASPNAKLRAQIIPGRLVSVSDDPGKAPHHPTSARVSWARLLKRVFDIDIEHCLHCGGTLKIITAIEDPAVIARILAHLGLPTRATALNSSSASRSLRNGLIPH
jgi:hypothetical protein